MDVKYEPHDLGQTFSMGPICRLCDLKPRPINPYVTCRPYMSCVSIQVIYCNLNESVGAVMEQWGYSGLFWTYLSFRQTQVDSQFRFPPDGDVSIKMELFLQLQPLMVGVNHPVFLLRSRFTCHNKIKHRTNLLVVTEMHPGFPGTRLERTLWCAGCMPKPIISAHRIFTSCVLNPHQFVLSADTQIEPVIPLWSLSERAAEGGNLT